VREKTAKGKKRVRCVMCCLGAEFRSLCSFATATRQPPFPAMGGIRCVWMEVKAEPCVLCVLVVIGPTALAPMHGYTRRPRRSRRGLKEEESRHRPAARSQGGECRCSYRARRTWTSRRCLRKCSCRYRRWSACRRSRCRRRWPGSSCTFRERPA
jgi:hypothetical protein